MEKHPKHLPGTPCWIDTLQPDVPAAMRFYGALLGWEFEAPAPMPGQLEGEYVVARIGDRTVGGIGQAPAGSPAVWTMFVGVAELEAALVSSEQAGGARLLGPLDAAADGRFAVVTDPDGVAFGVWQIGTLGGIDRSGEPGTLAMCSLHAPDLGRAAAFYGAVFGWTLEPVRGAPFAEWRLADHVVGVASPTRGTDVPPHWSICLAVGDANATAEQAVALGGHVLMPPVDTPAGRSAVITDPQGGVIAVNAPVG